jgi:hypothetical protein
MPVSKKRKKKPTSSNSTRDRARSRSRSTFTPTALPEQVDPEAIVGRLMRIKPEALPSVGLAEWYMASTPVRNSNQCVLACATLMGVLVNLGLKAEPVALQLDVPDGRGGTTRYGNLDPHFDAAGNTVGHVGLIADEHFIDVTASQYPEIARGGMRVVYGPTRGQTDQMLTRGTVIQLRTLDDIRVEYTTGPLGSADAVIAPMLGENREELARMAFNTITGYTKTLSLVPELLERVNSLTAPRHTRFVDRVNAMTGREIVRDEAGNWRTKPAA